MVLWDKGWNFAAAQYEQFCEHHSLLILILGTTGCQINVPCFPSTDNHHCCFMTTIKWTTFTLISASPSIVKALISSLLRLFYLNSYSIIVKRRNWNWQLQPPSSTQRRLGLGWVDQINSVWQKTKEMSLLLVGF